MVNRISTSFWDLQFPACSKPEEPNSSPSAEEANIVFQDPDHNSVDGMIPGELDPWEVEYPLDDNLEWMVNELYGLNDELLENNGIMDESFNVMSSLEAPPAPARDGVTEAVVILSSAEPSRSSCFTAWKRSWDSAQNVAATALVAGESQKLLKKVLAGGAWTNNGGGGTASRAQRRTQNHAISERRRRENLNEMFLILKSLVPSIHKTDQASILAETVVYLRELKQKVENLESTRAPTRTAVPIPHHVIVAAKNGSAGSKRRASELGGDDAEREHHSVLSKDDGLSNVVNVTVKEREALLELEVQCRWKKLLMTQIFDAIKSLHLDALSVRASTRDGLLMLKIRAQVP